MAYYDDTLRDLQQQVARKQKLTVQVEELYAQREELEARVWELEKIKFQEQSDVDRLECRSLAAFFYNVIGKMDEKLDKEREEAYAAQVKYDAAAGELEAVRDEIQRVEAELRRLSDCETRYADTLRRKAESIKHSGSPAADTLLRLEERVSWLENQRREIGEAVAAGHAALQTTDGILKSLGSAEGWGTWDLMGGDFLSDMAKYSHLDKAQRQVEVLQSQLRRFKTELADVTVQADLRVSIDGFLQFADFFFDGLVADWMVQSKIRRGRQQLQQAIAYVEGIRSRLWEMLG